MNCNKCGAEINDNVMFCTECGAKIEQDVNHENVYEYSNVNTNVTRQKHTGIIILGITVGVFIVIAVIMAAIIIPKASVRNQRALELYDKAYENFYSVDYTYTSPETARLIGEARQAANSIMVLSDTKKNIEYLYKVAGDYTLLSEAEDAVANGEKEKAQNRINEIIEKEVKQSDRYKTANNNIDMLDFKNRNKESIQKSMSELDTSLWDGYVINRYCGCITDVASHGDIIEITLWDYDNQYHNLNFYYSDTNSDSWNTSITQVRDKLDYGENIVMAVAVVESQWNYPNRIVSFSYSYE